jgi:peroxiredoxin
VQVKPAVTDKTAFRHACVHARRVEITFMPVAIFYRIVRLLAGGLAAGAAVAQAADSAEQVAFGLRDIGGAEHSAAEKNAKATVWLFIAHDCPVCNSYAPEIARICNGYASRGVRVNIVYTESEFTSAAMTAHAREHGYATTLFSDREGKLAKACGITITPEVAVIAPDGQLAYRGRIDDRYVRIGHERAEITSHDLRDALDAMLAGKPIAHPRTQAVGCYVGTMN